MILNEDYFKDIEITDDDIESSNDLVISHNNEYATPEDWFMDMKSKYAHCIEIPLNQEYQWKWDLPLILKRLFYIFDAYGIEYSEYSLHEFTNQKFRSEFFQYNFIDYNGHRLMSKCNTPEEVTNNRNTISIVIFFNLPDVHSYKSACVFVSNILSYIQNDMIKDFTYGTFLLWDFNPVAYARNFSGNCTIAVSDILSIVTLFFPEKSATIRQELYANDDALLNKLLRCFRSELHNDNW